KVFDTPTVLLCGAVSGEEEIPIGVQAVLVRSAAVSPDILSHVAVRARNAHVLVAVCFEKKVADELERLDKKWVAVICARDGSSLQVHDEEAHRPHPSLQRRASKLFNRQTTQSLFNEATLLGRGASFVEESRRKLHCQRKRSSGEGGGMSDDEKSHSKDKRGQTILLDGVQESEEEDEDNEEDEDILQLDQLSEKWCIPMNEFKKGVVGGKSNNIKRLSDVLDSSVLTPRSVALPFGCMQKTLADPSNKACLHQLATDVVELSPSSSSEEADKILSKAKGIMSHVELPQSLLQALEACMQTQDKATSEKIKQSLYQDGEGDKKNEELERLGSRPSMIDLWHRSGAEKCTEAIKAVWMSLFGLRPWVSLTKAGRKYSELNMAVLVQELMPAHCAFVLHSRNPFSDDPEEMYGELALGLGEVIVGNFAGRSLGWRMKRGGKPIVVAFPSKSECLTCPPCLIF
ncbi:alpha-glucan water dikinase, partial [Cystoisospora suis]